MVRSDRKPIKYSPHVDLLHLFAHEYSAKAEVTTIASLYLLWKSENQTLSHLGS